jgi:MFS transporter, DHA1 family, inner membrane transport protein
MDPDDPAQLPTRGGILTPRQEVQLLAVLGTSMFIVFTSGNMLAPLLLELAGEFHTSVGTVGQLTAASAIPWAVLAPLMGALSDRHGRRPVMAIGLALLGLSIVAQSQAQDYTSLFLLRVIGGIGGATTGPNAMAAPADYFPPSRRGRAMGILMAGMSLSTVIGVPLVAVSAAQLGWRWVFVGVGVLLLILAAAVWMLLPRTGKPAGHGGYLAGFATVLNNRVTLMLLLANLMERCSFIAVTTYLASFLMLSYSFGLQEIAPVLSGIAAGTLLGSVVGGRLADRGKQRTQYSVLLTLSALLAYPLFASTPGVVPTAILAASFGVVGSLARPAWLFLITRVPDERRGATTGFAATTNQIGIVFGGAVGGLLVGLGGYTSIGILAAGTALISAATCAASRAR